MVHVTMTMLAAIPWVLYALSTQLSLTYQSSTERVNPVWLKHLRSPPLDSCLLLLTRSTQKGLYPCYRRNCSDWIGEVSVLYYHLLHCTLLSRESSLWRTNPLCTTLLWCYTTLTYSALLFYKYFYSFVSLTAKVTLLTLVPLECMYRVVGRCLSCSWLSTPILEKLINNQFLISILIITTVIND